MTISKINFKVDFIIKVFIKSDLKLFMRRSIHKIDFFFILLDNVLIYYKNLSKSKIEIFIIIYYKLNIRLDYNKKDRPKPVFFLRESLQRKQPLQRYIQPTKHIPHKRMDLHQTRKPQTIQEMESFLKHQEFHHFSLSSGVC